MKAKKDKLINEAMELIKEFTSESAILSEDLLESVCYDDENDIIKVKLKYEEEKEYELFEISEVFIYAIEYGIIDENVGLGLADSSYLFKKLDKENFINHIGQLYYTRYRCQEIYDRLQEIEKEYRN